MEERIDSNKLFMETAILFSKRSTCLRKQVGGVLVKDGRIVSTGYNGVPSGQEHCSKYFKDYFSNKKFPELHEENNELLDYDEEFQKWIKSKEFYDIHREFSIYELHCEQNIISRAGINGVNTKDTSLYITLSPCLSCATLLYSARINFIIYLEKYDRDDKGIKFLNNNNIPCLHYKEGD